MADDGSRDRSTGQEAAYPALRREVRTVSIVFYRIWDLVYSKAFRAVAVLVVLVGVVVGAASLGSRLQPGSDDEAIDQTTASQTVFASKCAEAVAALTEVIDSVPSITLLDAARREAFVDQYATAARTCSYVEFVEVDRSTVTPFAAGASMFATLEDGLHLDADAAVGGPDAPVVTPDIPDPTQEVAGR